MLSDADTFLTVQQAAKLLGVSSSWLNKLRLTGGGPPFFKLGRRVLYRRDDIDAWTAIHLHAPAFFSVHRE